jgi:hypothetical protein
MDTCVAAPSTPRPPTPDSTHALHTGHEGTGVKSGKGVIGMSTSAIEVMPWALGFWVQPVLPKLKAPCHPKRRQRYK